MLRACAALALLVLAGCCSLPFSPLEVSGTAPASGGVGPRQVTVQVTGPDEPVDGVPVMVFWTDPGDGRIIYLLGLRSAEGRVQANVPDGVALHVAAGGGEWTDEWRLDLVAAGSGPATAAVEVYPRLVQGNLTGTWDPAAASVWQDSGLGAIAWRLEDVTPGASDATREGFAERLASVTANVTWSNAPTAQADLGFGAWHSSSVGLRCTFHDGGDELGAMGIQDERYDSSTDGYDSGAPCGTATPFGDAQVEQLPPGIHVGVGTARPALMPTGLAYRVDYSLAFGYPIGIEQLCERLAPNYELRYVDPATGNVTRTQQGGDVRGSPPAALPLVALALLAAAFAWRRR